MAVHMKPRTLPSERKQALSDNTAALALLVFLLLRFALLSLVLIIASVFVVTALRLVSSSHLASLPGAPFSCTTAYELLVTKFMQSSDVIHPSPQL